MSANEVNTTSFEEALGMLETTVNQLESGQLSLDAAISAFEKGTVLAQHCQTLLADAEQKIQVLSEGQLRTVETFDE